MVGRERGENRSRIARRSNHTEADHVTAYKRSKRSRVQISADPTRKDVTRRLGWCVLLFVGLPATGLFPFAAVIVPFRVATAVGSWGRSVRVDLADALRATLTVAAVSAHPAEDAAPAHAIVVFAGDRALLVSLARRIARARRARARRARDGDRDCRPHRDGREPPTCQPHATTRLRPAAFAAYMRTSARATNVAALAVSPQHAKDATPKLAETAMLRAS
jgi:hypothetical protein